MCLLTRLRGLANRCEPKTGAQALIRPDFHMFPTEHALLAALRDPDDTVVEAAVTVTPTRELARVFRLLSSQGLLRAFAVLDERRSGDLFVLLDADVRIELLALLPSGRGAQLFALLDPDDRAWLGDRLPAELSQAFLDGLPVPARDTTVRLMGYPPRSVGRSMSPHVIGLKMAETVEAALDRVRRAPEEVETVYMLPVTDDVGVVLGVVSLRRLITSDGHTRLHQLMSKPAVVVGVDDDQETAARLVRRMQLIAAPVVDSAGRLVGVLTVDDAMRILTEADEEDVARVVGSERLRRSYLVTSVWDLVRSRIGWLLVLILAATLTVNVLDYFEDTLAEVVALALFVPLLIGTGGNVGAQSATTVVRAMAVGDVQPRDVSRVLGRELATGLLLGVSLGAVGFLPATLFVARPIALVVCLSLVVICVLAAGVGSLTPLVARRIGIDPAVVSAPFISTIVDATGLVVYFLAAKLVLGI